MDSMRGNECTGISHAVNSYSEDSIDVLSLRYVCLLRSLLLLLLLLMPLVLLVPARRVLEHGRLYRLQHRRQIV